MSGESLTIPGKQFHSLPPIIQFYFGNYFSNAQEVCINEYILLRPLLDYYGGSNTLLRRHAGVFALIPCLIANSISWQKLRL